MAEEDQKKQPNNDDDEVMEATTQPANIDNNNGDYNEILSGKVVLITGANRGIGKSFVDVLLEKCPNISKIYAAVRNIDSLSKAQGKNDDSPRVVPLYMDLSKPETVVEASSQSSDVQIIINNAGVLLRTTNLLENQTITNLQTELQVNVFGLLHLAQQYIPILLKNNNNNKNSTEATTTPSCWFIQINSVASFRCAYFDVATYSASKAAAYSITQAIQQQFQQQQQQQHLTTDQGNNNNSSCNVQVLSVHPGPIATDMMLSSNDEKLIQQAEDPQNVVEEVLKAMLKKRQELGYCKDEDKKEASSSSIIHVFPDKKSKNLSNALEPYIQTVIEDGKMYG